MAMMTRLASTVASRYYPVPDLLDTFFMDGRTSGKREARSADVTTDKEDKAFLFSVFSHAPAQGWDPAENPVYEAAINEVFQDLKSGKKSLDDEIGAFINMAVTVTGRMRLQSEHNRNPFFAGVIVKDAEAFAVTMGKGLAFLYRDDILYPLTSADIQIEPINARGQKVNSFQNFCAAKTATALCSNIAQLKMDDCLLLCSQSVYDALGQREILRLLDESYDQSDAAGTIITAAAAKTPGVPLQIMISFVESVTAAQKGGGLFGRNKKKKQPEVVIGDAFAELPEEQEVPVVAATSDENDKEGVPPDFIPNSIQEANQAPSVSIPGMETESAQSEDGQKSSGFTAVQAGVPVPSVSAPAVDVSREEMVSGQPAASNTDTATVSSAVGNNSSLSSASVESRLTSPEIISSNETNKPSKEEDDEKTAPTPPPAVIKSTVEKVGLLSSQHASPIMPERDDQQEDNASGITFVADDSGTASSAGATTQASSVTQDIEKNNPDSSVVSTAAASDETVTTVADVEKQLDTGFSFVKEESPQDKDAIDEILMHTSQSNDEVQKNSSFQQYGEKTDDGFFIPFETEEQKKPIESITEDIPDMPLYDAPLSPPTYPNGSFEPNGFDMTGAYARGTYQPIEKDDEDADMRIYGNKNAYQSFSSDKSGYENEFSSSGSGYQSNESYEHNSYQPDAEYASDDHEQEYFRGTENIGFDQQYSSEPDHYQAQERDSYQPRRQAQKKRPEMEDAERRFDFDDSDPTYKRNRVILIALAALCLVVFTILIVNAMGKTDTPVDSSVSSSSDLGVGISSPDGGGALVSDNLNPTGTTIPGVVPQGGQQQLQPGDTGTAPVIDPNNPNGTTSDVNGQQVGDQPVETFTFSDNIGFLTWWDLFHWRYQYDLDPNIRVQDNGYVRKLLEYGNNVSLSGAAYYDPEPGLVIQLPNWTYFADVTE